MSEELANEFIGKVCTVYSDNTFGIQGKIIYVQDKWLKIETKSQVKLVNLDYVTYIDVLPEKYQK